MNWFLAKIVYRIICGNGKHTAQFEEQLRLIQATDACAAMQKAKQIGEKEQVSFLNHAQQTVCWKLIAVTDVYPFSADMDGAEIFSCIKEEEQPASFIYSMQLRAGDALKRYSSIVLS
ncbi:DUF4288 domain-containing protein [Lacibacter luteus]|uniref:DUF4288 domain-containing protein n=1 Tax=Lacibacter luteus TaxID=2508719 RepID=A0A4Q1CGK7_9BACT|nr:DUF4288 domain-containing protein [Lacibacter luteus]RXK59288.1 DUF4288 domain-containing protein [Lacibacter luteus]